MEAISILIRNIINYFDEINDKNYNEIIKKNLKKESIIFDIGAHHGETVKKYFSFLKIKKIYSFEPSKKNFEVLKKLKKKFGKSLEIFNVALSDKNSSLYLNIPNETSSSTINKLNTSSRYYKRKKFFLFGNLKTKKEKIKVIKLDNFVKKNNINCIDLIKIDTEGYEYFVLRGFKKNIKNCKFIKFEHHYNSMIKKNYNFRDINKLLKENNFKQIYKHKMCFRKTFEYLYKNKRFK